MQPKLLLTKEYLEEHYVRGCKSERVIADELGVKSVNSVRYYVNKYGLVRASKRPGLSRLSKDYLEEHYVRLGKSVNVIAASLGIAKKTVRMALKLYGISLRSPGTATETRRLSWKRRRKGAGDIPGRYWSVVKAGARLREFEFSIPVEYAWQLFLKQNRKCALTGRQLRFYGIGEKSNTQTASLDRIDSAKGYVEGNIQWVHKDLQRMKSSLPQDEFIKACLEVANIHGAKFRA